jgi:hypothetical protein
MSFSSDGQSIFGTLKSERLISPTTFSLSVFLQPYDLAGGIFLIRAYSNVF